jgi:hypothetical protein
VHRGLFNCELIIAPIRMILIQLDLFCCDTLLSV